MAGRKEYVPAAAEMLANFDHVPSLDGLRAVSIWLVLLAHIVNQHFFPGGLGVLTFFVISGFLITRLLIGERKRTGSVDVAEFYKRRFLRLYPAVVSFVLVVSVGFLVFAPSQFDINEPFWTLAYGANYLAVNRELHGPTMTMPFVPFWSLSVEEQYYLAFPLVILMTRGKLRPLFLIALAAYAVPLALRFTYATLWPQLLTPDNHYIYFRTETRIDLIATGVLIAVACETERGRKFVERLAHPLAFVAAIMVLLFCLGYRDTFFRETIRYTLENVAAATILCSVVFSNRLWLVNWALNGWLTVWFGLVSYSLYVWHEVVAGVAPNVLAWLGVSAPAMLQKVLTFVPIIAAAAFSYYVVERPIRGLRARRQR